MNDVSGQASPGTVMGIIGPSGAGKSTLLDLLAARISNVCTHSFVWLACRVSCVSRALACVGSASPATIRTSV